MTETSHSTADKNPNQECTSRKATTNSSDSNHGGRGSGGGGRGRGRGRGGRGKSRGGRGRSRKPYNKNASNERRTEGEEVPAGASTSSVAFASNESKPDNDGNSNHRSSHSNGGRGRGRSRGRGKGGRGRSHKGRGRGRGGRGGSPFSTKNDHEEEHSGDTDATECSNVNGTSMLDSMQQQDLNGNHHDRQSHNQLSQEPRGMNQPCIAQRFSNVQLDEPVHQTHHDTTSEQGTKPRTKRPSRSYMEEEKKAESRTPSPMPSDASISQSKPPTFSIHSKSSSHRSTSTKKKYLSQKKPPSNPLDSTDADTAVVQMPTSLPPPASTTPTLTSISSTPSPPSSTALGSQEVSITASTTSVPRIDSTASSLSKLSEKSATEKDANAGSAGVIDLLKHSKNQDRKKKKDKVGSKDKKDKTRKKKKTKGPKKHPDEISNARAARAFNSSVRKCVEQSDPDGIYELLHDKHNHKFALDANVLETVLKAFCVAAMFEDALYCLRNCTLTGTLKAIQTEKILQCLPQNLRNSSAYVAADMINALCIATEFDLPTHRTYFMRIARGIALEFLEEATSARDRICSAPCERLVRSAVCVVDARLRRGKKATELVVVPGHQLGVFVPEMSENRGIQAGDAVGILPYAGPYPMSAESLDRNMIEATVTGIQPMVLRLQDKTNAQLHAMLIEPVEGNVYRIDKLANRMGFNRQLSSAVAIAAPLDKDNNGVSTRNDIRRPSAELIKAITAMDENIDRVMLLGGNISRKTASPPSLELTSTAALCAQPVPFFASDDYFVDSEETRANDIREDDSIRDAARLALENYGAFEGLNSSQKLAVEGAATNRLTLVQGPPGTGKTAVAIRIIQHWARLAASEGGYGKNVKPILATSDSNIAVDNLVEGCANVGLRVVRLGRPEAIRPELLRHCIDRPQGGNGNGYSLAAAYKEKMKVLKNAQVVCCTCIGSGADILDQMNFERVLVDEATQATEPAVLVPLTRNCRQLVLVGDHCQLPPTVLSTRAEEEGLGVPLFSRMVACGVPPFMLDTQYRMHPGIAMFPSDLFYGGKLLSGVSAPERRPLAGFPWPREEFPVAFVPVHHGLEFDDGVSKINEAEAAAVCDAVQALLDGGQCTTSDIAVVTPYAAQVRLIRRMLRKLISNPPYVEVSSTDGFQGREKEAVIFSAVRSNDYGAVGFVSDWRRVNVSFTRARRGLIVIGNDVTLRRGDPDTWMPWLAWADAHGINMDKPGVPRGRYDAEQLRKVRGGTTAAEMLKDVLARQQAQLKTAEKQLEKAEKKSSGHITGGIESSTNVFGNEYTQSGQINGVYDPALGAGAGENLNNGLALLSNAEGCWDDSDDDEGEVDLHHSVSVTTFATSSTITKEEPQDAWDL